MPSEQADEFSPEERQERSLKGYIKLGYVALIFWPFLLLPAFMAFDSPHGASRASASIILPCALCFGGLPFVTHIVARLNSEAGRYKAANWIAALPMTLVAALFGLVVLWAIVMDMLIKLHITF
jgi:hypothetical protein